MSPKIKILLESVASWPAEDQEELAAEVREIVSRHSGIYRLSDDERAAVQNGTAAAERGDFAPESEMEEFYRLHHKG